MVDGPVTGALLRDPVMKSFPRAEGGVLLPVSDRATAAAGLCLYTASRPPVLAVQRLLHAAVRVAGARVLPGPAERRAAPYDEGAWALLVGSWREHLGPVEHFAAYHRRQSDRTGSTLVLTGRGLAPTLVKVRDDAADLDREQRALAGVRAVAPTTFRAAEPRGLVSVRDDLHWSAQSVVFERPHRPASRVPSLLFDEVAACLDAAPGVAGDVTPAGDEGVLAHRDLTPWNLRVDHRGQRWLFDWEDWGPAPAHTDYLYFHACARGLLGESMPAAPSAEAVSHLRTLVTSREHRTEADRRLGAAIERALDEAVERAGRG